MLGAGKRLFGEWAQPGALRLLDQRVGAMGVRAAERELDRPMPEPVVNNSKAVLQNAPGLLILWDAHKVAADLGLRFELLDSLVELYKALQNALTGAGLKSLRR